MATVKEKLQQAAVKVEDARRQLEQAENEFDALFKQVSKGKKSKTDIGDVPDVDLSTVDTSINQIAALIKGKPDKEWNYDEISAELPSIPRPSIRVFLYKLKDEKQVLKVSRGKWKAMPTT
jgi:molecular chaperone DnaK (HSP70)